MAIRLDQIPAMAFRPAPPRFWPWLGVLVLCLMLGVAINVSLIELPLDQQPVGFWLWAVGVPFAGWCVLWFGRMLVHVGDQSAADGWDQVREKDWVRMVRQGRRSQQVLSASFSTALLDPAVGPAVQLDELLKGSKALRAQPSRTGESSLIHSRWVDASSDGLEVSLLRVLKQRLANLAPLLAHLPADKPLGLLLEIDCRLPAAQWRPAWRHAWQTSGIRQSTVPVEGHGLDALDHWLDQRIDDQAMLLVVAVQFAPENPEGSAEAGVAVLLGNRLTQNILAPIAYLHRPEQERESNPDPLLYAARQALDWVPLPSSAIERVWRAGVDGTRSADLAQVATVLEWPSKDPSRRMQSR